MKTEPLYDKPHAEKWTLALQRHYLGIERIGDSKLLAQLEQWLDETIDSACSLHRAEIGASCNHDFEILGAASCHPRAVVALRARNAFVRALKWTLGELDASDLPAVMRYFGGTEQMSSDYETMRVRAVMGLRLGFDNDQEAQRVTGHYLATVAAISILAAAPGPDEIAHRAGHGGLFFGGPALSPVGGRGNHFGQVETEAVVCVLLDIKASWAENRYGDSLPFLRLAQAQYEIKLKKADPDEAAQMKTEGVFGGECLDLGRLWRSAAVSSRLPDLLMYLRNIRFKEAQHFMRFDDGSVAVYVERQPTNLSPSYMAWVYYANQRAAEIGFPFPDNAKSRGKELHYPLATCAETDRYLVVQGGLTQEPPIELPDLGGVVRRVYEIVIGPASEPVELRAGHRPGPTIPVSDAPSQPKTDDRPVNRPTERREKSDRPRWKFW